VAQAAQTIGQRISVIAAGERWPDGSLRPAIEDWIGAGAIIAHLTGSRSPEAEVAYLAFLHAQPDLIWYLRQCGSGCELIERGYAEDILLAAELNMSDNVPILTEGVYQRYTS
jgi:2-phosphosulfolactate phosphatase